MSRVQVIFTFEMKSKLVQNSNSRSMFGSLSHPVLRSEPQSCALLNLTESTGAGPRGMSFIAPRIWLGGRPGFPGISPQPSK